MAAPLKASLDAVTGEILETPELRAEGLRQLRELIRAEQTKKPFATLREDADQFLLSFLRSRKYEVPRAFAVYKSFCHFWHTNPHVVEGLCAAKVRATYELGFMQLLPPDVRDQHGNHVTLLHMGKLDYSKFTPADLARLTLWLSLAGFEDEHRQLHGVTYLETMEVRCVRRGAGSGCCAAGRLEPCAA